MKKILFLTLLFIHSSIYTQDILELSDLKTNYSVGSHLEYLEDISNQISEKEIRILPQSQFTKSTAEIPNFGNKNTSRWFRFNVKNLSRTTQWVFELDYPMFDYIDVYYPDENQNWIHYKAGDHLPFLQAPIYHRNPAFPISIQQGVDQIIYFKIASSGPMYIRANLRSEQHFYQNSVIENTVIGFFIGLLCSIAVYNLFVFFSLKDLTYLYYSINVIGNAFFVAFFCGLAQLYIFYNFPLINHVAYSFMVNFMCIMIILFSNSYLEIKKYYIKVYKFNLWFILFCIITNLLVLTVYPIGVKITNLNVLISSFVLLYIAFKIYQKGFRTARFFLIAWFPMLTGIILRGLQHIGLLTTNFITLHGYEIACAWEVVILSLGLADKINFLNEEAENAKNELIEEQKGSLERTIILLESFSKFVPNEFLNLLNKRKIEDIQLGDSVEKQMTVFFTDIRNFTSMSEKMTVHDNFKFLNSCLNGISPIVNKNNGFIDKFIGDSIMALFTHHPEDALKSGIEMLNALKIINLRRKEKQYDPINIGIGIHTGELMLGTVGSIDRMETTVIGDTVNLAARLESQTKTFGNEIIISDKVYKMLKHPEEYFLREIASVLVKGKSKPVIIYECYDADPSELKNKKKQFSEYLSNGLQYYKSMNLEESMNVFSNYIQEFPEDSVGQLYYKNLLYLQKNPPTGDNWNGVIQNQ